MRPPVYAMIDLNTRTSARYEISETLYRDYIGGKTLGAKLLYDLTPAGVDPLGWRRGGVAPLWRIEHAAPLPCTILAVSALVKAGGAAGDGA